MVWFKYLQQMCSPGQGVGFRGNTSIKEQEISISSLYFTGHMCCPQSGEPHILARYVF
jgi:hypothetical protein